MRTIATPAALKMYHGQGPSTFRSVHSAGACQEHVIRTREPVDQPDERAVPDGDRKDPDERLLSSRTHTDDQEQRCEHDPEMTGGVLEPDEVGKCRRQIGEGDRLQGSCDPPEVRRARRRSGRSIDMPRPLRAPRCHRAAVVVTSWPTMSRLRSPPPSSSRDREQDHPDHTCDPLRPCHRGATWRRCRRRHRAPLRPQL